MIELEERQELGRAKNAIQDYLVRKLLVPKVYLDAKWSGTPIDVLAIDRAGVGDVHAVSIVSRVLHFTPHPANESVLVSDTTEFDQTLHDFMTIQGHFKYLAVLVPDSRSRDYHPASKLLQKTLAKDGVGRIGVLFVDLSRSEPAVISVIKPERFRTTAELTENADNFVAAHIPNWEVRD